MTSKQNFKTKINKLYAVKPLHTQELNANEEAAKHTTDITGMTTTKLLYTIKKTILANYIASNLALKCSKVQSEVKFSRILIGHTRLTYVDLMSRNDSQPT